MIQSFPLRARSLRTLALLCVAFFFTATVDAATPKITGTPVTSVTVGQAYSFKPNATDADGDKLRFSIVNRPPWMNFSSATGELSGVAFAEGARVWSGIVISVSDGKSTVSLPTWSLTVKPNSNKSPTITGAPVTTARVGSAYSFQVTAKDPEGKPLKFSIRNKPVWATFNTSTGKLSGTPTAPGTTSSIIVIVTDGVTSASLLPAFSVVVSGTVVPSNSAPAITGTPPTTAQAGLLYSFKPSASDANGDALTFSVVNKPSWASFSTSTGQLIGTPTIAGTESNIQIRASDGKAVSSLPAFAIVVSTGSTVSPHSVGLGWTPPTEYTDGSVMSNLAGYRIWYGKSASDLSTMVEVSNPGISSYVVEGLTSGAWYFAITAFTKDGAESDHSAVASASVL